MPKVSVSLPEDVLSFVDELGSNRSKTIVTILQSYQRNKQKEELTKAYDDYAALCEEDDSDWWPQWEAAEVHDVMQGPKA